MKHDIDLSPPITYDRVSFPGEVNLVKAESSLQTGLF